MSKCTAVLCLILYCMLIQGVRMQCCLMYAKSRCYLCPINMHLYRNNCIYNIPNCISYSKGFDCSRCEQGYYLKTNKCLKVQQWRVERLFHYPWMEVPAEELQSQQMEDVVEESKNNAAGGLTGFGLLDISGVWIVEIGYIERVYRIFYYVDQGFVEHMMIKRNPANTSLLIYQKVFRKKQDEQIVDDRSSDPNIEVADKYLKSVYPAQQLQKAKLIDVFIERNPTTRNILNYRLFYYDRWNGIRDYEVPFYELFFFTQGYSLEFFGAQDLDIYTRGFVNAILYQRNLTNRFQDAFFLNLQRFLYYDTGNVVYNLTLWHYDVGPDEHGLSNITFVLDQKGQPVIQDMQLYRNPRYILQPNKTELPPARKLLGLKCEYTPQQNFSLNVTFVTNYTSSSSTGFTEYFDTSTKTVGTIQNLTLCTLGSKLAEFETVQEISIGHNDTCDFYRVVTRRIGKDIFVYATYFLLLDVQKQQLSLLHVVNETEDFNYVNFTYNGKMIWQQTLGEKGMKIYKEKIEKDEYLNQFWFLMRFKEFNYTLMPIKQNFTYYTFKFVRNRPFNSTNLYTRERSRLAQDLKKQDNIRDLDDRYCAFEYLERTYQIFEGKIMRVFEVGAFPEFWDIVKDESSLANLQKRIDEQFDTTNLHNLTLIKIIKSKNRLDRYRVTHSYEQRSQFRESTIEFDDSGYFEFFFINLTVTGEKPGLNCDPYDNCSIETLGLNKALEFETIQQNRTIFRLVQFNYMVFVEHLLNKTILFVKQIDPFGDFLEGDNFFQIMYYDQSDNSGFKSIFRLGGTWISADVMEVNTNFTVGQLTVNAFNQFYTATKSIKESAKKNYSWQIQIFQNITGIKYNSTKALFILTDKKLTIIVRDQSKNYTFFPGKFPPKIETMSEDKQISNQTTQQLIRYLKPTLINLLGLGKTEKTVEIKNISDYINLFDFELKTSVLGVYDEYKVAFQRADRVEKNRVYPYGALYIKRREKLTFKIVNLTKGNSLNLKFIPISYEFNSSISFTNITRTLEFYSIEATDQNTTNFIRKLYGIDAYVRAQRKPRDRQFPILLFVRHFSFGNMAMLVNLAREIIYGIQFSEVLQENNYGKITDPALLRVQSATQSYLHQYFSIIANVTNKSELASQKFTVILWQKNEYNTTTQLKLIYESRIYVVQINVLVNTSEIQGNQTNFTINVLDFDTRQNEVSQFSVKNQQFIQQSLQRFRQNEYWAIAQKVMKEQYKYYLEGASMLDFETSDYGDGQKFYRVQYEVHKNVVEVQLMFNTLTNVTRLMPLSVLRQATPIMDPYDCRVKSNKGRQCLQCKNTAYLHRDLNCYPKINNCKLQSGSVCVQCSLSYFKISLDRCY